MRFVWWSRSFLPMLRPTSIDMSGTRDGLGCRRRWPRRCRDLVGLYMWDTWSFTLEDSTKNHMHHRYMLLYYRHGLFIM